MFLIPQKILIYQLPSGRTPFRDWFGKLDCVAADVVSERMEKVESGYFGDYKNLGDGIFELRIHFAAGYRIYFGRDGLKLILLLCGGDKGTQKKTSKKQKFSGGIMKTRKENKKNRELPSWNDVVSARYKNDPEFLKLAIKRNFKEYIKTGDDFFLRQTLRRAAEVKGVTQLAKETGLSRQYLYDMLSEKGNPTLLTFRTVLNALGFEMYVREVKSA